MKLHPAILASCALLATSSAFAQVTDPNTGNTYDVITKNMFWTDAEADAKTQMFGGTPGHLATITSQAELDFVMANLVISRPWLGGFHDTADPNYSEPAGGWAWVTGEPFTFTNWSAGEPNDTAANGGPEDYLEMFKDSKWNDTNNAGGGWTDSYLVEWEGGGSIGTNYCSPANTNSSGQSAVISAVGSTIVAANNLTLTVNQMPLNQFGYFLNSDTKGFIPFPGGSQGNLCLGGSIGRHTKQIGNSGSTGVLSISVDLTNLPRPAGPYQVLAGETWNFTCWFRDKNPTVTSNFSDGITITFQ